MARMKERKMAVTIDDVMKTADLLVARGEKPTLKVPILIVTYSNKQVNVLKGK